MWGDERVRDLSATAEKRIWTRLIIGECTTPVPGLVLVRRTAFAEALKVSTRAFDRAFAELEVHDDDGFTHGRGADWNAGVIVLPKALKQAVNVCTSTSSAVAWSRVFSDLAPQCLLTRRHRGDALKALAELGEPWVKAFLSQSRGHYRTKNNNKTVDQSSITESNPNGSENETPIPPESEPNDSQEAVVGNQEAVGISGDLSPARTQARVPWNGDAFQVLWVEVVQRTPIGAPYFLDIAVGYCAKSAEIKGQPVEDRTRALMAAYKRVRQKWQAGSDPEGAITIEGFTKHFEKCETEVDEPGGWKPPSRDRRGNGGRAPRGERPGIMNPEDEDLVRSKF